MNYYNEFDRHAAAWLRELIKAGLIPDGVVDERSIVDVKPEDLDGYTQCHFFAGIGGWSYALRLAGVPDDVPVWTGSCPCQPFSCAGKRSGQADKRHLWPEMFRLIKECRPPIVFGEQVEAAIRLGWLDGVFADLEGEGYACGSAVLGAHSVGAPHIRQRLYWVSYSQRPDERLRDPGEQRQPSEQRRDRSAIDGQRLGESDRSGREEQFRTVAACQEQRGAERAGYWDNYDLIQFRDGKTRRIESGLSPLVDGFPGRVGLLRGYGNAIVPQVAAAFIEESFQAIGELT